jgi:hypothetical protein
MSAVTADVVVPGKKEGEGGLLLRILLERGYLGKTETICGTLSSIRRERDHGPRVRGTHGEQPLNDVTPTAQQRNEQCTLRPDVGGCWWMDSSSTMQGRMRHVPMAMPRERASFQHAPHRVVRSGHQPKSSIGSEQGHTAPAHQHDRAHCGTHPHSNRPGPRPLPHTRRGMRYCPLRSLERSSGS